MTDPAATSQIGSQIGAPRIRRGAWLDALRFIVAGLIVAYHCKVAAPVPPALALVLAAVLYTLVHAPTQRLLYRPLAPSAQPSRLRQALAALAPHPEAQDFGDIIGRRTYVEVSISKGPLNRG